MHATYRGRAPMDLMDLAPLLGGVGTGSTVLGVVVGMILARRFVLRAVHDADAAHEQAISTHRQSNEDLKAEFSDYRRRTAAEAAADRELAATERARLEERLAAFAARLDECHAESLELFRRVTILEARPGTTA